MRVGALGWAVVVLLVVLHFVLHVALSLQEAAPDLLTVALLIGARDLRVGWAAGLGFLFGLLEDALSVLAFGANMLTMTLLGALGATTRELFVGDSRLFVVSYFLAGKWVRDLLHWLFLDEALRGGFLDQVVIRGLPAALYVAVVGLAIALLSGRSSEA